MVTVADISDRYLRLAIEHFERTDNPQRRAKLRKLAGEYKARSKS
jgi:hypothetical protein